MKLLIKLSRCFYAIALLVYGVQQFIFDDFRNVILPAWQQKIPWLSMWAFLFGILLIITGILILLGKRAKEALLVLGGLLLAFFLLVQVPFELFDPKAYGKHLGSWTSALKELALSGGAFVIAGTYRTTADPQPESRIIKWLEKITPYGYIFFCITMVSFGISHFVYADFVKELVPEWITGNLFWTYLAGVALIGSGVCILSNFKTRLVAMLLGSMIFLWFIVLHLPRAIAEPIANRGNEFSSTFDALAFCGIALAISCRKTSQSSIPFIHS